MDSEEVVLSPELPSILHTKDIVKPAKKMHLDAVCITDYNTMKEVARIKKIEEEYGLLVFGGIEVRSMDGDILVFGLREPPPTGIMAQELVEFVHREGGVAIPAHPFRSFAPSLGRNIFEIQPFDALEVLNGNAITEENQMALEAAQELNLPGTGGSDALPTTT